LKIASDEVSSGADNTHRASSTGEFNRHETQWDHSGLSRGARHGVVVARRLGSCCRGWRIVEPRPWNRVLGFQDSNTGAFHALTAVVPDATVTPITGTVHVTFNIKLVTAFAKGTVLQCTASVDGTSVNTTSGTDNYYEETATDNVAISGSTATCTAVIPYSWLFTAASSTTVDTFSGTYSIAVIAAAGTAGAVTRGSSSNLFSATKIPASGTTSNYTVNATL